MLLASMIENCWKYAGLIREEDVESADDSAFTIDLEREISLLVPQERRMAIAEFFNPVGEDHCTQWITDEDFVSSVARKLDLKLAVTGK